MKDNLYVIFTMAGLLLSAPLYAEDVSKKAFDGWGAQVALGIGGAFLIPERISPRQLATAIALLLVIIM